MLLQTNTTKRKMCQACGFRAKESFPAKYTWCPYCKRKLIFYNESDYFEYQQNIDKITKENIDVKRYTTDELI